MFNLSEFFSKLEHMKPSTKRDTVEDSYMPPAHAIMSCWMLNCYPPLTLEIDTVLANLKKRSDPVYKEMDFAEREMVLMVVKTVQKQREIFQKEQAKHGQAKDGNQGEGG
jgi:hypothetical protein